MLAQEAVIIPGTGVEKGLQGAHMRVMWPVERDGDGLDRFPLQREQHPVQVRERPVPLLAPLEQGPIDGVISVLVEKCFPLVEWLAVSSSGRVAFFDNRTYSHRSAIGFLAALLGQASSAQAPESDMQNTAARRATHRHTPRNHARKRD
jgi:hypothetical protein